MTRRSGLGRGLGSLIPHDADVSGGADDVGQATLHDLPIDLVDPNPYQPRRHFDEEAIDALTASIAELGVLQPVLVRPAGDRFELIAGERRWRAARRAGLDALPAIVRTVDDEDSLAQALVENIHRRDLNALEEAAAYRQLLEDFDLTHDDLARRVGRSRAAVSNILRLLQLPAPVQRRLVDGQLSAGHARALLGLPDRLAQEHLAHRIVEESLTVREAEDLIRAEREPAPLGQAEPEELADPPPVEPVTVSAPRLTDPRPAGVLELEEILAERLATSVEVRLPDRGPGRILIAFADDVDLERLARVILDAGSLPRDSDQPSEGSSFSTG